MNRPHLWEPGSRPALLLLHGTGGDEHSLVPLASRIAPGSALLAPRGTVREGELNRHFRRHAEGVLDADDLYARTDELADFIRRAGADHGIGPGGPVVVGFSNGANIATSLIARHPGLVSAAVLIAAMAIPVQHPLGPDSLAGLPVAIVNGDADDLVPAADTAALRSMLTAAGAAVTDLGHPGGHEIPESRLADLAAFVAHRTEAV